MLFRTIQNYLKLSLVSLCILTFTSYGQNVLLLSSDHPYNSASNLEQEFVNEGATVTTLLGELSNGVTLSSTTFDTYYDIVLILGVFDAIENQDITVINDAIQNKKAGAFILFLDGAVPLTLASGRPIIELATSWNITQTFVRASIQSPLNTGSPYSDSFTSMNPMYGAVYSALTVPSENALYLKQGATIPGSGIAVEAYALFVPITQSYNGNGACLFLVADVNPLTTNAQGYAQNQGKIGPAFIDAATNPQGSCFKSKTGNIVTAIDDNSTTQINTAISVTVLGNDSELLTEGLQLSSTNTDTTSANGGTITINGSNIDYTPATGFTGTDTFTYEVCVPSKACDTAVVTIVVNPSQPPVAKDDSAIVPQDGSVTIDALGNDSDPDGDPLTITEVDGQAISEGNSVTLADGTVVTLTGGQLHVTPPAGSTAPIKFTYTIDDGKGNSTQGSVSLTVTATPVSTITAPIPILSFYGLLSLLLMMGLVTCHYRKN